jgi:hypothetical protein
LGAAGRQPAKNLSGSDMGELPHALVQISKDALISMLILLALQILFRSFRTRLPGIQHQVLE